MVARCSSFIDTHGATSTTFFDGAVERNNHVQINARRSHDDRLKICTSICLGLEIYFST